MAERLQKYLASAGLGSRRQIEQWIREGRIKINGVLARLGDRIDDTDELTIDNKPFTARVDHGTKVLLFHKPLGIICSRNDPQGRQTVFQYLPPLQFGRWVMVGRLDLNTSGLLLFTNNGELAARLMHPKYRVQRQYLCRVYGTPDAEQLQRLREGVVVQGRRCRFERIQPLDGGRGKNHWFRVTLREGRNREVRRIFECVGLTVNRLRRDAYGPVHLPELMQAGSCKPLSQRETARLCRLVQLNAPEKEKEADNRPQD